MCAVAVFFFKFFSVVFLLCTFANVRKLAIVVSDGCATNCHSVFISLLVLCIQIKRSEAKRFTICLFWFYIWLLLLLLNSNTRKTATSLTNWFYIKRGKNKFIRTKKEKIGREMAVIRRQMTEKVLHLNIWNKGLFQLSRTHTHTEAAAPEISIFRQSSVTTTTTITKNSNDFRSSTFANVCCCCVPKYIVFKINYCAFCECSLSLSPSVCMCLCLCANEVRMMIIISERYCVHVSSTHTLSRTRIQHSFFWQNVFFYLFIFYFREIRYAHMICKTFLQTNVVSLKKPTHTAQLLLLLCHLDLLLPWLALLQLLDSFTMYLCLNMR